MLSWSAIWRNISSTMKSQTNHSDIFLKFSSTYSTNIRPKLVNSSPLFRSISWKFLAILFPAITMVALVIGAAYTYMQIKLTEQDLIKKIETISQVHSLAVAHPLWTLDIDGLNRSLKTIALHPEIVCVDVIEEGTNEPYQWPPSCADNNDTSKLFSKNLLLDNQSLGKLDLYYTNMPQRDQLKQDLLKWALFFFLLVSFAAVTAYLTLQYTVGRPIKRLMTSIKKTENSDALETVEWSSNDELGNVISAYNNMINQIEQNTDELVSARQQAEAAAYTKSRFLANMSHELRTPLNAVIGITEMLREEAEEEKNDTEPFDRVAMSGRHLLQLIDDILDFSKLEAGRVTISMEQIDLGELLSEVCTTIHPMAENRNNRLQLDFSGSPDTITTDPFRLKQILINLLSNACKFTDRGEIFLKVGQSTNTKDRIFFTVRDTGIGISEDQHERLFSDFVQADISTTRQYGGSGLGLAISQRLCELLGGRISLQSTLGKGSEFSFTLLTNPT